MEDCRFETSELHASFMISTQLLPDSWSLCNTAKSTGSIQIQQVARITYVALPTVPMEMIQLGDLVSLKVAGDGLFPGLISDEPSPMVDSALLKLFRQIKIKEMLELELVGKKLVVITGHSTGGALAALTALWLLSQPLPPSFRLLCITFGSPLLGNQSLSTSISRSRLAHNFYHVVSIHDHVPRSTNDQFWPFGTYLFCSDNGGVCLENADYVRKMFLLLNTTRTPNNDEQERYGHYVLTLSHQFFKSRSFLGGNISDNSYQAGVALAVEALGFSNDDPSGVAVKECIEAATRTGRAPILRSAELANELASALIARLEIQWYKDRCDASEEELGYYDLFKRSSSKRDYRVNLSRLKLGKFWDKVLKMVERNELPFDFQRSKKWVFASQFYQLLAEPLDIAHFYKHRKRSDVHYLQGKRPERYEVLDKWWKHTGEREKNARSIYTSTTQDTCFWAKLEEAKECLDDVTREDIDAQRRSLLWEKIVRFESYAKTLVENKDVSKDVVVRRSSYIVWVENLREFKLRMGYGNGNQMDVDENEAMETLYD